MLQTVPEKKMSAALEVIDKKLNGKDRDGPWAIVVLVTPFESDPDQVKVAGNYASNNVDRADAIRLMKRLIQEFEAEQKP